MKNQYTDGSKERLADEISAFPCDKKYGIYTIKSKNARKTAENLFDYYYGSADRFYRYENVVFDCSVSPKPNLYAYFLSAYKRRDFDETRDAIDFARSKEKAFRFLLNEYIRNFKRLTISERKNLYFDITAKGEFIAIKKIGYKSINCDLSASERTLFNFLCFIEINKFRQFINGVIDFNYKEKPLILLNFPDFLDERFDYIAFLKQQKLKREIFIVSKSRCTENAPLHFV